VSGERAEQLRARFCELAPEGFEELAVLGGVELAAYGEAASAVLAAFPDATVSQIDEGWEERCRDFRSVSQTRHVKSAPW